MSLLFVMSASGSFIVLLYITLKYFAGEYLTAKWKNRILRIALFFYLCPFQLIKIYLQRFYYHYWTEIFKPKVIYYGDLIQITSKTIPTFSFNMTYKHIYMAGLVITFLLLCYGVRLYGKQKKCMLSHSKELPCDKIRKYVKEQAEELKIKRKIICRTCIDTEAVSVGILHPVIILNELDRDEHTLGWIVKHELIHIKNHDVLMRMFGMIVFAVNFYNPLAFYLLLELISVSELVCDETITALLDEEERVQYCKLLFETACKERKRFMSAAQFNNNFKLKERIEIILKGKVEKNKKSAFVIAVIICSVVSTVLISMIAYAQPQIIDLRDPSNSHMKIQHGYDNDSFMFFIEEGEDDREILSKYMSEDEIALRRDFELDLDGFFVDGDGNKFLIEVLCDKECLHFYDCGKYYKHSKNGEDCAYYVYNAKRCRKCGVTLIGVPECKFISQKCMHHKLEKEKQL